MQSDEQVEAVTVYDLCREILYAPPGARVHKASKPITDGLRARRTAKVQKEGLFTLTVEEILAVRVERIKMTDDEKIVGYQRVLNVAHARAISRSILSGHAVAPPTLALDDGLLFATDGQHRLVAAVIARSSLKVTVENLDESERRKRFADQAFQIKPSSDVLILGRADVDPVAGYIRDAIEAEHSQVDHPLSGFVGLRPDRKRLGIVTVYNFLSAYSINAVGNSTSRVFAGLTPAEAQARAPRAAIEEGTELLRCFGPKQTSHPHTYAPATVRALRDLAIMAVGRSSDHKRAAERWVRLMPKFKWGNVRVTETHYHDIRTLLTRYWNRNLPEGFTKIDF